MKNLRIFALVCMVSLASSHLAAQTAPQSSAGPMIFKISGTLLTPTGEPRTGTVTLMASLYQNQTDTAALWVEYQQVTLDANGRYTLNVGSTFDGGVPKEFFISGTGRWLGITPLNEPEQPRILLVAVAYAVKALDADTLSGKTADYFVTAQTFRDFSAQLQTSTPITGPSTLGTTSTDSSVNTVFNNTHPSNNAAWIQFGNAGGTMNVGLERSIGGAILGGTPGYAGVISTNQASSLIFGTNATPRMTLDASGNLGIGASPSATLHVGRGASDSSAMQKIENAHPTNNAATTLYISAGGSFFVGQERSSGGSWLTGATAYSGVIGTSQATPIMFGTNSVTRLTISATGNVGIGTTSPTAKLDVAGDINVSGNINAKYQDVAEWVETPTPLEPGTVVIIDPSSANRVLKSVKANDTRVAGAVSKQPGLILGEGSTSKEMVAQSGRVRVKVDARYGAIRVGDLLVTSPTPGYAMRARPVKVGGQLIYRSGTILGKALEALPRGKGEVLVLLTLQ